MATSLSRLRGVVHPAIKRLQSLSPLEPAAIAALEMALGSTQRFPARRELFSEGRPIGSALLVLEGWAARVRQLPDGRRQLISFGLPGDILGFYQLEEALASTTVAALTSVTVCPLPDGTHIPTLAQAYAVSRALDEAYLIAQVTRIGRFNAHERIIDLLLEFYERLSMSGLAADGRYHIALTQEAISDALGLTSVHINRTLQSMRAAGELTWTGREVVLHDPISLASTVGHVPARVCARVG